MASSHQELQEQGREEEERDDHQHGDQITSPLSINVLQLAGGRRRGGDGGGELAGRAGGADGAGRGPPDDAGADVPDVGARHDLMRRAVLPQHLLLVPQRAARDHGHLGADRRRAARPPHGSRAAGERLFPRPAVGVHP